MNTPAQRRVITIIASLFLALTYIGFGYAVVAGFPAVTEAVANATIDETTSPFDKTQLVEGAVATREYSFGNHDKDAYYSVIATMNAEADTPYAQATQDELMTAPDAYSIGSDALAHLDDVNAVASRMLFPIMGCAAIAAFLLMVGLRYFGISPVARSLFWGGAIVLVMLAVLAIWGFVSFDSLFAACHTLLFPEGTWTFPADSLLITMLPEAFWGSMAGIWLGVSVLLSAVSLALGIFLDKKGANEAAQTV